VAKQIVVFLHHQYKRIEKLAKPSGALTRAKNYSYLSLIVGRYPTHIIMHSWQNWNWFSGHIHTSKDHGSLRNAGQSLMQLFRRQVMQLQIHMIFLRPASSTFQ
jgi:hypothetical protein